MLKIMIIDDEYYFREALKISIPWKELGLENCGEAKNGKDALEKLEDLNPDILLVDINMPIMDGLEFVQHVREAGCNSKIIMLTGQNEFSYAKQALQMGVNNYILKPVNEEELIGSLLELKGIIEKEANIKIEFDSLKQQVKDSLPQVKDKFLNELIQGRLIPHDNATMKRMEYLDINTHSEVYQAVTIELDYEENLRWSDEDAQLWKFAVSNVACEIIGEKFCFDICYDMNDRICMIIGADGYESESNHNLRIEKQLDWILQAISRHLSFTVTIGVGSPKKELFDIAASYKESIVALKNRLTVGKNKIIFYSSVEETGIKSHLFTSEHRSQLLMNMRIANDVEVQMLINKIFRVLRSENVHYGILFVVCIEMVSVCLEYIVEVGLNMKDILPKDQMNIIEEIQSKRSVDEIENWMKEIYQDSLDAAMRNKSSKASKLIDGVKRYISEHYQNDELDIDEIAKGLFVNYAHLCFIFKRDTGITINEYLTEFRIKKAKELLDGGNTLVLDVASRVGYADANYFGKCFKKYYGLAPSKYIENIRQ